MTDRVLGVTGGITNFAYSSYGYDAVSRLTSLAYNLNGAAAASGWSLTYNPAGQIASVTRGNDLLAWQGHTNRNTASSVNGLNQLTAVGVAAITHDGRGNLTSDGTNSYTYDVENRLLTRGGGGTASLVYDPLGRLFSVTGASGTTQFLYDGHDLIAEYVGGAITRRYVHGPGADTPVAQFEGSGTATANRRWLGADERGSIVTVSDGVGGASINTYDEYGVPAATNTGRFGYTGQVWLPELGMWHYKARMYDPGNGRFLQADPIGYGDGMNMYGYVGGDPVNGTDPEGRMAAQINCKRFTATTYWVYPNGSEATHLRSSSSIDMCIPDFSNDIGTAAQDGQDGEAVGGESSQNNDIIVKAPRIKKVNQSQYRPTDPERYRDGDYPRVEGCIRFVHECLAQPSTLNPNGRGRCLGAERLCQAESFWRGLTTNDEFSFDFCHNYSCFSVDRTGRVRFYDKRFSR